MGVLRVFGYKDLVIQEPAALGNGAFRAGISHRVIFVLEVLTQENLRFWDAYARTMKACAKTSPHASEIEAAIKGFENALELAENRNTLVFIAYSTFDVSTVGRNDIHKTINIQMCMTVTTSARDPSFPAVTHMGIFRSPLIPAKTDSDIPQAVAEAFRTREDYHQFYRDKPAKGISLVLHSFAARAMTMMCQGRPKRWMITAPLPHMGGLLGDVGKIVAIDESEKKSTHQVTNTNSPKGVAPSTSSSLSNSSSSPSMGSPVQVNHLSYRVDCKNLTNSWIEITCQDFHAKWYRQDYPWLFVLAFNPSHLYKATFTDFRVLAELHQDIVMMGTEHTPQVVVTTPSSSSPSSQRPRPSSSGTAPPNQGTVKGTGTVTKSSIPPK